MNETLVAPQQKTAHKSSLAVASMRMGLPQRQCACGGSAGFSGECESCRSNRLLGRPLQRKLAISEPRDRYEQEADRIADQVMASSGSGAITATPVQVQRFTGSPSSQPTEVPASVERVLASPGQPLEPGLQEDMQASFGHDFSRVRIHSDSAAAQSATDVNARAYTVGQDIVFGPGHYGLSMPEKRKLLAHELTHVLQQSTETEASGKTIFRQMASLADWQVEAERLTPDELGAEIEAMRRELMRGGLGDGFSWEGADELVERLAVYERVLLDRDRVMTRSRRALRGPAPVMVLAAPSVFISGLVQGAIRATPPGEIADFFTEDLLEHPIEFMEGCEDGVGRGLIDGANGLVEGFEMTAESVAGIGQYILEHGEELVQMRDDAVSELGYQTLGEDLYTSLFPDSPYLERRRQLQEEIERIESAFSTFQSELARNPAMVSEWTYELGSAMGEAVGSSITDDFLRAAPFEQGVIVGRIMGQILFEIILGMLLEVVSLGVASVIRAIPGLIRSVRAWPRASAILREMVESSEAVRRLIRSVSLTDELGETALDLEGLATRADDLPGVTPSVVAAESSVLANAYSSPNQYLEALRGQRMSRDSMGVSWDDLHFPIGPRARWQPGDSPNMPSSAGISPTFDTGRRRMWRNRAHFELEARLRGDAVQEITSDDPIRRMSHAELRRLRDTPTARVTSPRAPHSGHTMELEHFIPQRVSRWLVDAGFSPSDGRRLTRQADPASIIEVTPLEHAFFDYEANSFGSLRADSAGRQFSTSAATDPRSTRPLMYVDEARLREIVRRASSDPDINLTRVPDLRAAIQAEIDARGLDISMP